MDTIQDRLPPAIVTSTRQRELFEAIDEYWSARVTPSLQRLRNLRSVFTASNEDLALMLEELTAYSDDASSALAKPLSIFWKKNEINNKNNEWAIEALIQRLSFSAKDFSFEPLYAPRDTATRPYGTEFYTMDELIAMEDDVNDFFITSQMRLRLDYNEVLSNGWDEAELRSVTERYFEENVRPTHIVFNGLKFRFLMSCINASSIALQSRTVCECELIS